MDDRVSPVGPLAGAVVAEMLTPFMVYADLLRASGSPTQSKMVWALLENLDRKLMAMFIDIHRQAPNVRIRYHQSK